MLPTRRTPIQHFGRRSKLSPKVQPNNFLLLSNPLTTEIGTKRHFAAERKFGTFWIEADIAAGFLTTRPSIIGKFARVELAEFDGVSATELRAFKFGLAGGPSDPATEPEDAKCTR